MSKAIKTEGLSKSYQIRHEKASRYNTLGEELMRSGAIFNRFFNLAAFSNVEIETLWALRDVDFEISTGDCLGIIGGNGAGKSTLLKILSGITEPTKGRIGLNGKIASLLEVGTGFHPELTGKENIYLNGSILGMTKRDISLRFDEIVDFSGVEQFLDTPVKRYSSGMYVRLAFAVAAHLETEIIVIDEVLAVGDAEFQEKCLGKMREVGDSGRTVIFVSHSMGSIKALCNKSLVLKQGQIDFFGDVDSGVAHYYSRGKVGDSSIDYSEHDLPAQLTRVALICGMTYPLGKYDLNESTIVEINFSVKKPARFYLGIDIVNSLGQTILFWRDIEVFREIAIRDEGLYQYRLEIPAHTLSPDRYLLRLALADYDASEIVHQPENNISFTIVDNSSYRAAKGLVWRGVCASSIQLELMRKE
jgi:lipopolysaccharide transport system ATP-binding protein